MVKAFKCTSNNSVTALFDSWFGISFCTASSNRHWCQETICCWYKRQCSQTSLHLSKPLTIHKYGQCAPTSLDWANWNYFPGNMGGAIDWSLEYESAHYGLRVEPHGPTLSTNQRHFCQTLSGFCLINSGLYTVLIKFLFFPNIHGPQCWHGNWQSSWWHYLFL